jgi:inorganic pyrophosphatase
MEIAQFYEKYKALEASRANIQGCKNTAKAKEKINECYHRHEALQAAWIRESVSELKC